MNASYRHRQTGWILLIMFTATLLLIGALSVSLGATSTSPDFLLAFALLAIVAALFSSMTVELQGDEVNWYFGPRFWTKRLGVAEIERATPIKTKWYWGYGIKFFGPGRWLYNVSGTDAVELTLKRGGWVRLGTDDVAGLMQGLRARGL